MNDKEKDVLAMFDKSQPKESDLFETSTVNHLAWSLLVIAIGVIFWFALALVNAENRRNAYASNACPDPVFKGAVDPHCMVNVQSREHWWEHLTYALTHLRT